MIIKKVEHNSTKNCYGWIMFTFDEIRNQEQIKDFLSNDFSYYAVIQKVLIIETWKIPMLLKLLYSIKFWNYLDSF